ncbi:hypothetical protein, partial [Methylobacterium oryzisoli]|uniref:hypothetical protein n=1 Tax=Methylobacterium oryzisoli TaxID=3385502 RepID=UPI00397CAB16
MPPFSVSAPVVPRSVSAPVVPCDGLGTGVPGEGLVTGPLGGGAPAMGGLITEFHEKLLRHAAIGDWPEISFAWYVPSNASSWMPPPYTTFSG